MRSGEENGRDYFFVSEEEFSKQVADGEMLEHAQVFDCSYGSPKKPVENAINHGEDVLFDIDWQGAQQISNSALQEHVLSIFILPPSISELKNRLEKRGQDTHDIVKKRMKKSWDEISHWAGYDYVVINDDLDKTEAKLKSIVAAERLRRSQQPGLLDHVRTLQTEFEKHNDL
jgi:guanylate kinase